MYITKMSNFYLYFDHAISDSYLSYNVGVIGPTDPRGPGLWYQAPIEFINPITQSATRNSVTGVITVTTNMPTR